MFRHTLRRRMSALGAVLGLTIALPLTTGATPAYAAAELHVTKSHTGSFVRGGQVVYHIVVSNTGSPTTGTVTITDNYPQGLTFADGAVNPNPTDGVSGPCPVPVTSETGFVCELNFVANSSWTFDVTLDIASDAPCGAVTNTVTVSAPADDIQTSASDNATITGAGCGDGNGNGGGGTSILPVNLSGVVTLFNNISTNNNLLSPGATNTTHQSLGINAP
ncbi:hypothetical protein ACFTWH_12275 [Streptomyces sp. NPDC057011]|uniref:hypothetical protein n=1 Tax=unclassified Streptomyces TaxID=2593676 RepID=UPI003640374F